MHGQRSSSLAERLEWLFQNVRRADGKVYTYQEVADGTAELGYRLTNTTIWKIRTGETTNPGYLVLQVLAQFFGVSPGFFYDEHLTQHDLDEARLADVLQQPGVREIMLRSSELSLAGREAILRLLRHMQAQQSDSSASE